MKIANSRIAIMICVLICVLMFFCKCDSFLEKKPLASLAELNTLDDLEALLDNAQRMNESSIDIDELMCGNSYVTDETYNEVGSYAANEAKLYIWQDDGTFDGAWESTYRGSIYYANIVLDRVSLVNMESQDEARRKIVRGRALFHRAFAFHRLAQLYAHPYAPHSLDSPGIVLKLSSNINEHLFRSNVRDTYGQILNDLKEASQFLPERVEFPTSPNKGAAYGLLARVYLTMNNPSDAKKYAELALEQNDYLLNFNELVGSGAVNIPALNSEILFHSTGAGSTLANAYFSRISPVLYNTYSTVDLRKKLFFIQNGDDSYSFQGSYNGGLDPGRNFDGLTTAEMVLILAECLARDGNVSLAMTELNKLWRNRCDDKRFEPLNATEPEEALSIILDERRKETICRSLWWSDLRRLNVGGYEKTLVRTVNNETYELPARSPRWTLQIPQSILDMNPHLANLEQHKR